jgi:dTDP-4-amino-4,6-dideoxygalactose transaminase
MRTQSAAADIAEQLHAVGIDARSSVNPWIHRTFAASVCEGGPWPVAEEWRQHLLSLPIYPALQDQDVHYIVHSVKKVFEQ